jgi:hypothetical protein
MAEPTVPGAAPSRSGEGGATAGGPAAAGSPSPPTDGSATAPRPGGTASDDTVTQIIDAGADLLVTSRDWLRQETEGIVREKVGKPLQDVGAAVGAVWAAASLLVLGLVFVAVAALVWLSQLIGVPLAFLLVGSVLLAGSAIFLFLKIRRMQANAEALEKSQELRGTAPAPPPTRKAPR